MPLTAMGTTSTSIWRRWVRSPVIGPAKPGGRGDPRRDFHYVDSNNYPVIRANAVPGGVYPLRGQSAPQQGRATRKRADSARRAVARIRPGARAGARRRRRRRRGRCGARGAVRAEELLGPRGERFHVVHVALVLTEVAGFQRGVGVGELLVDLAQQLGQRIMRVRGLCGL